MEPIFIVLIMIGYLIIGAGVLVFLITVLEDVSDLGLDDSPGTIIIVLAWPMVVGFGIPAYLVIKGSIGLGKWVKRRHSEKNHE